MTGLVLPVSDVLNYLRREFEAPVPEEVLRRAAALPVSSTDVVRYQRLSTPRNLSELIVLHWWLYSGGCRVRGLRAERARFVRYCLEYQQSLWHLRRTWHVFPRAALEIAKIVIGRTHL